MFKSKPQDEPCIELGPHGVELTPCHDTPMLSTLTGLYLELKAAIEKLLAAKTKVGLTRGRLSKENQQRSTASESSVFGADAVNRLYAFSVARAEFELEIVHVERARTKLGLFLAGNLLQAKRQGLNVVADHWMLSDVTSLTDAPHAFNLVARHNVASAIAILTSLRTSLPRFREYLLQLPEFPNVLWNAYCAHENGGPRFPELWNVLIHGEPDKK